jgi:hypothetical protein
LKETGKFLKKSVCRAGFRERRAGYQRSSDPALDLSPGS